VTVLGGLVAAAATVSGTWALAGWGTRNLPATTGRISIVLLLSVAGVVGFLAGSVICRRATRNRDHLALFSGLAGGVAGGIVGCAFALTVTAAYLASYTTWPQDRMDQVLVLLSYPVFGSLGFCLGGLLGLILGLTFGGVLKLTTSTR
jgi:hypothetical protein